ncbi:hypothetical protein P8452_38329 [Trifolium repens]|nr:hypothetical protein P8452_38329 [Trifolium repens]
MFLWNLQENQICAMLIIFKRTFVSPFVLNRTEIQNIILEKIYTEDFEWMLRINQLVFKMHVLQEIILDCNEDLSFDIYASACSGASNSVNMLLCSQVPCYGLLFLCLWSGSLRSSLREFFYLKSWKQEDLYGNIFLDFLQVHADLVNGRGKRKQVNAPSASTTETFSAAPVTSFSPLSTGTGH